MRRKLYFTPGPSELYFTVEDHLKSAIRSGIPSISHRSLAFQKIFKEASEGIKELLALPDGYHVVFTSSANEVWERILQNLVEENSMHWVNGAFSKKFYDFAQNLGKKPSIIEAEHGKCVIPENVKIPSDTELLALTHNETSTGVNQPIEDIASIRKQNPDLLIALDVVSSAPSYPFDYSLVDTAYFSVQKCFGLPAGLGVWIYNERILEKHKKTAEVQVTGSYHSLSELHKQAQNNQTPETPNVLGIYLFNEVVKDLLRRGKDIVWSETRYKSALLYHTFTNHPYFQPFVAESKWRSATTLVFQKTEENNLLEKLAEKNIILGKGYGKYAQQHIRIANFPTHSKEQVEMLVDIIDSFK